MRHRTTGFTLIEMVVVVAIIALLAGITMPVVAMSLLAAETSSTGDRMQDLAEGIEQFYQDTARLPNTLQELVANGGAEGWQGPYVSQGFDDAAGNIFHDAWRQPFQYEILNPYTARIRSTGYNKRDEQGGGDDIDLEVSVARYTRRANQKVLDEINAAIAQYNRYYRIARTAGALFAVEGDDEGGSSGPPYGHGPDGTGPPGQANKDGDDHPGQGNAYGKYGKPQDNNHTPNSGHWHTHWYVLDGAWTSHTQRHDLSEGHTAASLHPGYEELVNEEDATIDIPLLGPWPYTFSLLELRGLLDNSDDRYTTDAWGQTFITGPDPVQYVRSAGAPQ